MNIENLKIEGSENYFSIRFNFKYLLITACVCIIASIAYYCYPINNYCNEELFAMYYQEPNMKARGSDTEAGMFFKAISSMKNHDYETAKIEFRKTLNERGQMHDHAQWYMMLCLLKTNSSEEMINAYLCDMVRNRGQYSKKATKILYHKSNQEKENENN